MHNFVVPFWDPYCALVGVMPTATAVSSGADSLSIELLPDGRLPEFIGELRLPMRCVSDFPFFSVPRASQLKLRFRLFNGDVEAAREDVHFDAAIPDEELFVSAGLLWRIGAGEPPALLSVADLKADTRTNFRRAKTLLKCRATKDGRVAPADAYQFPIQGSARHVGIGVQILDDRDPYFPKSVTRSREFVNVTVDLASPLEGSLEKSLMFAVQSNANPGPHLDIRDYTPYVKPRVLADGLQLHLNLGAVAHLNHVIVASLDEAKLRCGGAEGRALAFLNRGRRCEYDALMSRAVEDYLEQHNLFQQRDPLRQADGVELGPAGRLAVGDFLAALSAVKPEDAAGNPSEAALFTRVLMQSGINPLNVADVVRYANVIHALQWPKVFARWSALLSAHTLPGPPQTPFDIVNHVYSAGTNGAPSGASEQLAVWQYFRRGDSAHRKNGASAVHEAFNVRRMGWK